MKKKSSIWRIWAKALGEKSGKNDKESDHIAMIRSLVFVTYLITNCFIVAGVIRHWDDVPNSENRVKMVKNGVI